MVAEPIVAASQLRFRYRGGNAPFELRVPAFSAMPGERVAITGPSGSGKTTLLHLIAGVLSPDGGELRVLGRDLVAMRDADRRALRLRQIGLVFQEFELLQYLTVRQNILLTEAMGVPGDSRVRAERAESLAERSGIAHLLRRKPHMLSQGERQRVAVCRALLHEPGLILCDEPTGNLDPATTGRITELLVTEAERLGAALLMVSHNHEIAGRLGRVVAMESLALASEGEIA
ncbi:MAG: ABC transporter ATP-binding protein [Phycisphaerales bacterium]